MRRQMEELNSEYLEKSWLDPETEWLLKQTDSFLIKQDRWGNRIDQEMVWNEMRWQKEWEDDGGWWKKEGEGGWAALRK